MKPPRRSTEDARRRASFMAMRGVALDSIAAQLETPREQVEEWLTKSLGPAASQRDVSDAGRLSDATVSPADAMEIIRRALESDNFLSVSAVEDHDEAIAAVIGLWDVIAHVYSHVVDESVSFLETAKGVEKVIREDREVILVIGSGVDVGELGVRLRHWWRERLIGLLDAGSN